MPAGPVGTSPIADAIGLAVVEAWVRRAAGVKEGVEMGRYENLGAVGATLRMLASKEVAGFGVTCRQTF